MYIHTGNIRSLVTVNNDRPVYITAVPSWPCIIMVKCCSMMQRPTIYFNMLFNDATAYNLLQRRSSFHFHPGV
ncbi:hypothetical protein QE152_g22481 [Popillia japonica]|uniref:Uncharacterized protein n=1 Tax=Popillia japonica TaxID=7064 RepID=A0AAW1KKR3_POPJA